MSNSEYFCQIDREDAITTTTTDQNGFQNHILDLQDNNHINDELAETEREEEDHDKKKKDKDKDEDEDDNTNIKLMTAISNDYQLEHEPLVMISQYLEEENEEDNEGFRTPTSVDHKIPEFKHCPPPPRKIRPTRKRKSSSSSSSSTRRMLDVSKEIESMFAPYQQEIAPIIKKARSGFS